MNRIVELSPLQLRENCQKRSTGFMHERYCFEIFYRAICESSQHCWSIIYEQYLGMVYQWVLENSKGSRTIGETSLEEMVSEAFGAFWKAYTCEKLQLASNGLASVLNFLKSCAWSSVQHALRRLRAKQQQAEIGMSDPDTKGLSITNRREIPEVTRSDMEQQLWNIVENCCNNEMERVIAYLRYVNGWKPKEIMQQQPGLVADISEIYNILRNIKERVKRNPRFIQLFGDAEI